MKAPAVWLFAALASLLLCAQPDGWWAIAGAVLCVACLVMAALSDPQFAGPPRPGQQGAAPSAGRAPNPATSERPRAGVRDGDHGAGPRPGVPRPVGDHHHGGAR